MIQTDEHLARTREALGHVEAALASLYRRKDDIHPDRFALMAEPAVDQILRLRDEIDTYIGFAAAKAAVVPVWLRLEGPGITLDTAPTSVVTATIDHLRVGVQSVAEYLWRGIANLRPTSVIRQACDLRIVGLEPGSVRIGLSLPELDPELFPDEGVERTVQEAFDLFIRTASWAASDDDVTALEAVAPDDGLRRVVLNQVARLVPRPRGQLEVVELSGRKVRRGNVQLRRAARDRLRTAVEQTIREEKVTASGVIREIDLDGRTFVVRDLGGSDETRCAIAPEADELLQIAKDSLDYRVTVIGYRKVDPQRRQAFPLTVVDIEVDGREGE